MRQPICREVDLLFSGKRLDDMVVHGIDVLVLGGKDGAVNETFFRPVVCVVEVAIDVVEQLNGVVVQLRRREHEWGHDEFQLGWVGRRGGVRGAYSRRGWGCPSSPIARKRSIHQRVA